MPFTYENLLLTPPQIIDRVYGINLKKDLILTYNNKTSQISNIPLKERLSEGVSLCALPNGILISGGKSSLRKGIIIFFTGEPNLFEIDLPQAHYSHASIFFENKVYLIAGRNSTRVINNCETFDYMTMKWENLPVLRVNRSYPAITSFLNKIYIFGGNNGEEDLDTIEYYDNTRWKLFDTKLPCRLYGIAAICIDDNSVLIFGGKSSNTKYNIKIFTVNFIQEKIKVHNCEQKLGMCSSMTPLYAQEGVYLYNNDGELIKYCKHSGIIYRQKQEIVCKF